jgi:integration host factor subunit beta
MNVTKAELCIRLLKKYNRRNKSNLTIPQVKSMVEIFLDDLVEVMAEGSRIELRGFGCFKSITKKKRMGRNPRTGELVEIPACEAPHFKFSKDAQRLFEKKLKKQEILDKM